MKTTEQFYAVQTPSALNKKLRLAIGPVGPGLYHWRSGAVGFKRRLVAAGYKAAKVVKVRVTYTWS